MNERNDLINRITGYAAEPSDDPLTILEDIERRAEQIAGRIEQSRREFERVTGGKSVKFKASARDDLAREIGMLVDMMNGVLDGTALPDGVSPLVVDQLKADLTGVVKAGQERAAELIKNFNTHNSKAIKPDSYFSQPSNKAQTDADFWTERG